MGYATVSDPILQLALYSGLAAFAVTILMLAAVFALRVRLVLDRSRERRFVERWRPVLVQCMDAVPARLPPLARADRVSFLRLWNYYHESVRGPAQGRLNQLAIDLGVDEMARAMLVAGSLRGRLLATLTLGNLGDRALLPDLRLLVENPSTPISLTAARALLRIEPGPTLTWLLLYASTRAEWPLAGLAAMLAEVGVDRISVPLASAVKEAAGSPDAVARVPRLLKLARLAHASQLEATLRHLLETDRDDEVIAACVGQLSDPRDIDLARRFAVHATWFVRVAAAKALGRLAAPEDRGLLTSMLGDSNWWVRYRAAKALTGLPFVKVEDLRKIRDVLPDRYAAQMLDQAIAEQA